MINPGKLKEYHARHIRWTDESLKQLSFYNNLLLTLSVGFLSFSFNQYTFKGIRFSCTNVDCSLTLLVGSVIFVTISIILGLFVAINRLQDFRVSRHISLVRYRVYKYSGIKFKDETPELNLWKRPCWIFQKYPIIRVEDCQNYKEANLEERKKIKNDFKKLRAISDNLGYMTWCLLKWQTVCFAFGIAGYIMSILTS